MKDRLYIVMPVVNCFELTKAAYESVESKIPYTFILIDNASEDHTPEWAKQMVVHTGNFVNVRNDVRHGVAQSWNQGIGIALKDPNCKYIAVLNNDIILHPKTLNHLMDFMDESKYLMVTGNNVQDHMSVDVMLQMELPNAFTDYDLWPIEGWRAEGPDFSCFMINRETIRVIGYFDENFVGAYCEDQDYHARFDRARRHITEHNDFDIDPNRVHAKRLSTAPYYHMSSQTLARNESLRHEISINHGHNQNYYLRKWGGEHPQVMDGHGFLTPFGDATKNWRDW